MNNRIKKIKKIKSDSNIVFKNIPIIKKIKSDINVASALACKCHCK